MSLILVTTQKDDWSTEIITEIIPLIFRCSSHLFELLLISVTLWQCYDLRVRHYRNVLASTEVAAYLNQFLIASCTPATTRTVSAQDSSKCHDEIGTTTPRDWIIRLSVKPLVPAEVTRTPPIHDAAAATVLATMCFAAARPLDWCSWFSQRRNVNVCASWSLTTAPVIVHIQHS